MSNGCNEREARLLRECRAGSAAAWTELYESYAGLVRKAVRGFSRHWTNEDVEDITQAVFAELIAAFERFDGSYRIGQLIWGVAERKARDEVRLRQTAKRSALTVSVDDQPDCVTRNPLQDHDCLAPEDLMEREQMKSLLRQGMKSLNERCRQLLVYRDFEERSFKEIADIMGEKENTVTVWRTRCIDDLRALVYELMRTRCRT